MNLHGTHLTNIKLLLSISLLFPITAFAHLISISAATPFSSTIFTSSTATATFKITNVTSRISITVIDQSKFPSGSGLSIISSSCGNLMGPGESCNMTVQLKAPSLPQTIKAELREWAKPSADGVRHPFTITLVNPLSVTVGGSFDNNGNNILPLAYMSIDRGRNWTLSTTFPLPSGVTQAALNSVSCVNSACTSVGEGFQNGIGSQIPLAYTTSDGGRNWMSSSVFLLPIGQPRGKLFGVSCVGITCTAVGASFNIIGGNLLPLAYTSNDRGNNWTLSSPFSLPTGQTQGFLNSVTCSSNTCTAVGESSLGGTNNFLPVAYTSSDNGRNWTLSSAFPLPSGQTQGQLFGLNCVGSTCVALGVSFDNSFINNLPLAYKSTNGGINWTLSSALSLPSGQPQGKLFGATCVGSACTAVGISFDNSFSNNLPLAYTSSDSGSNWTLSSPFSLPSGQTEGALFAVTCIDGTCIAMGESFQSGAANILPLAYTSSNNGITWRVSSPFALPSGQTQGELFGGGNAGASLPFSIKN